MQTTHHDVVAQALHMAARGYRVEPCRLRFDAVKGKKAAPQGLPLEWQTGGLVDFAAIRAAFVRRRANAYLIVAGTSGLVGVDLDSKPEQGIDGASAWLEHGGPSSPMRVFTPGGGTHLYYADPGGAVGSFDGIAPGVDVRGVGGGLYGPGSTIVNREGDVLGVYTLDGHDVTPTGTLPGVPDTLRRMIGARGARRPDAVLDEFFRPDAPLTATSAAQIAVDQAQAIIDARREHGWSGFRTTLMRAAFTLGGLCGAGFYEPADVRAKLVETIRSTGAEPDADDLLWIEQGLNDGNDKPFRRADPPTHWTPPTAALPTNGHRLPGPTPASDGGSAAAAESAGNPCVPGPDKNQGTDSQVQTFIDESDNSDAPASGPRRLPMIPDDVWAARPWLERIRADARAREICPDAVLGSVLAIIAANLHHSVRIDTGTKSPLTLSLLVGLVGPSGSDKTTAFHHAMRMTPPGSVPALPTPSGEGIAERFMGVQETVDATGKAIKERVQTSHNALYYVDEGEVLTRTMDRSGATLGGQLRALWSGTTLGNTNASEDRRRCVPGGSYSIGFVVGYQPLTVVRLLRDTGTGMAQRFLWFTALDSADPEPGTDLVERIAPGALALPGVTALAEVHEIDGSSVRVLTTTREVTAGIVARQRARRAALDITEDDPDSQRDVLVAKVAALVVLLEGRALIEPVDWALAEALYDASAAVRDELHTLAEETEAVERRTAAARQGEADHTRRRFADDTTRVAGVITRAVLRRGVLTRSGLRKAVKSSDRGYLETALAFAVSADWLIDLGTGFAPGPAAMNLMNTTAEGDNQ
jgi:hypothetical protein